LTESAVVVADSGWAARQKGRRPGAHIAVLSAKETDAIEGRNAGFELRDTILVLRAGSVSFVFLFRVPLVNSLIATVQEGHGALNIDACRVRWKSEAERKSALPGSMPKANDSVGTFQTRDRTEESPEDFQSALGRWPCNVVLIHGASCRLIGEQRVEGHKGYPNGPGGSSAQFSQKGVATNRTKAWVGHADAEGKETIAMWECEDACPAKRLDRQSGILTSGSFDQASRAADNAIYGKFDGYSNPKKYAGNSGGASRFFPQFESERKFTDWVALLIGAS
jgi:hypothetical protein